MEGAGFVVTVEAGMNTKQVTWRKTSAWKTVGTVKAGVGTAASLKVTLIERGPACWSLCVLNREFMYGSLESAKEFCETPGFADMIRTLSAQWGQDQASAAADAANIGIGRECVSAPVTTVT